MRLSVRAIEPNELRIGNWLPVKRDGGPEEWKVRLYHDLPRTDLLNNAQVRVLSVGENPVYGERNKKKGEEVRELPEYVLVSTRP